ncbi:Hpt domain-containing protein [Pseudogemmobacter sp. W21_MBD1_M6]|uniref:Hpt domain-containing protein n=1 Tax=Pseudogemmobacter sp. W21_MBD1_M6 TaxID=3240271 RepID=UPI003F96DA0B
MTAVPANLPGLERIRARFLVILAERQQELETLRDAMNRPEHCKAALKQAQFILHKIAGTAGTLGFPEFGAQARTIENQIIRHLDNAAPDLPLIVGNLDQFLDLSDALCQAA